MFKSLLLTMCLLMVGAGYTVTEQSCGSYVTMKAKLKGKYHEVKRGAYYESDRALIEVWSNGDGGTWTILRVYANGTACVVAAGVAYRVYPEGDWT